MAGLLLDAYRLRKKTEAFDEVVRDLLAHHPGAPAELKTKAFMRGKGGWATVPLEERKDVLRQTCKLAIEKGDKI